MRPGIFIPLIFVLSWMATVAHAQDRPAVLKVETINEPSPTASCHASTIVETPTGLVAAWFGGTHERHPDVGIWVARLENGSWTSPTEVADGRQPDGTRHPTWNPVLFRPSSGPLMLFYKVGPDPESWWGMVKTSDDDGRTWSEANRLPEGIYGPIKNKPVQLPDGTIVSPSSTEDHGWRVHFERSNDGGQTWQSSGPVNDTSAIEAIQPSILIAPDGRLFAVGRTRQDRMFHIVSNDGGRTWGAMTLTGLQNPNSGLDAVRLADGRYLLVYNHGLHTEGRWEAGRELLNVALSEDGLTWKAALLLENEPGREFSYPAVIQTGDGLVHVTYTWKRQRIRHVVIDPGKLNLVPFRDGAWPEEIKVVRVE